MTSLPVIGDPARSAYSGLRTAGRPATGWIHVVMSDRNLIILTALCLIGLLVTLNLIFRFPLYRLNIEEIAQDF